MSTFNQVYTYRAGQKVELNKTADQIVVRMKPEEVKNSLGFTHIEQVSPSSTRVTLDAAETESALARSRETSVAHHAYSIADSNQSLLITDRILVTLKSADHSTVEDFTKRYHLKKLNQYGERDFLFQLTNETGMNPIKLIVKLTEDEPLVEIADHDLNRMMTLAELRIPDDEKYRSQWHLHTRFSNPSYDERSSVRCEEAWKHLGSYGSKDVVVGFTDDGCLMDHNDFNSNGKFAGWAYFEGNRLITNAEAGNHISDRMYKFGANHGTSCAGVIAAEADHDLTVGAAPGCRLLPIKWESNGPQLMISDTKMLAVLEYVSDKVDILSNSWGGVPDNTWSDQLVRRITELAVNGGRRQKGIVFLWAAGNENCPIEHQSSSDIPYDNGRDAFGTWIGVKTSREFKNNLVGIPGSMHVAALSSTAQRSHYSNYGKGISICAPSSNLQKYTFQELGLGITTTTGPLSRNVRNNFGGTSSATPLVAGIAALVITANPALSSREVVSILKQTSSKDLDFQGYPRTSISEDIPNNDWDVSPVKPYDNGSFSNNNHDPDGSWSPWFGYGKVDAFQAVIKAHALNPSEVKPPVHS
jgi:subtilisin family serine protease